MIGSVQVERPTLVLDEAKAKRNIAHMAERARQNGVRFRPHFKTHRSIAIGQWFRDAGVESITVATADMAAYFARAGWRDMTLAFPVNVREMTKISALAPDVSFGLLVDSQEAVTFLGEHLKSPARMWIDIDTGFHRTGIRAENPQEAVRLALGIVRVPCLTLAGILTHAGHSYNARSSDEILAVHHETVEKMTKVRAALEEAGFPGLEISVGDTPTMSVATDWTGIDEVRPGNFVFFDCMQLQIGSCAEADLALAIACPVAGKYPWRNEVLLYGGASHLSRDFVRRDDGSLSYGSVALPEGNGWGRLAPGAYVCHVSQVHGLVTCDKTLFDRVQIGDTVLVVPVHACDIPYLLTDYHTLDGQVLTSESSAQGES